MDKFGSVVQSTYDSLAKKSNVKYRLDWTNNDMVELTVWINEQVTNPTDNIMKLSEQFKKFKSDDVKILKILNWVHTYIKYVPDLKHWNVKEKWQRADQTLTMKIGDCEDGAILILVLARLSGIDHSKIKCVGGNVEGGGHCYVKYRADEDAIYRLIDWCYWYDPTPMATRKYAKEDKRYLTEWFGFNDKHGYIGEN